MFSSFFSIYFLFIRPFSSSFLSYPTRPSVLFFFRPASPIFWRFALPPGNKSRPFRSTSSSKGTARCQSVRIHLHQVPKVLFPSAASSFVRTSTFPLVDIGCLLLSSPCSRHGGKEGDFLPRQSRKMMMFAAGKFSHNEKIRSCEERVSFGGSS